MRQMSRPRGDLEHLVAFVPQHDGEAYSGMRVVVRNEDAQRSISPEGDTYYPDWDRSAWVETSRVPGPGMEWVWWLRR